MECALLSGIFQETKVNLTKEVKWEWGGTAGQNHQCYTPGQIFEFVTFELV